MKNKQKIGLVGLGIMGFSMAQNIAKKGFNITVYNRSPQPLEKAKSLGFKISNSYKDLADKTDVIIIMVTGPKAVDEILNSENGILNGNTMGKTLIQMSTIDQESTMKFSEGARRAGMKFLDCPVAGSKKQVDAAELIILAGGDESILAAQRELLLAMGKHIVHAGEIGKGTCLKLCMNLLVAQMTTALCESTALAKVQGVDPQKIFEVIGNSPAINCGYFKIKEKAVLNSDFSPAFSLDNMLKDVRFMTAAAKTHRLALPVTQAVQYLMEATAHEGWGNQDLTSITQILKPYAQRN